MITGWTDGGELHIGSWLLRRSWTLAGGFDFSSGIVNLFIGTIKLFIWHLFKKKLEPLNFLSGIINILIGTTWTSLLVNTFDLDLIFAAWRDCWHQHHPSPPPPHRHGRCRRPRSQGDHDADVFSKCCWSADIVLPKLKNELTTCSKLITPQLRPNVLRTEKVFRNGAGAEVSGGSTTENNGRGAMEMNYTTVQNGSAGVVIDGTTYTHAANGIGATGYIFSLLHPDWYFPIFQFA